ncbi:MAG: fibronectin type III domain-containing protein [Pseudomonadota bacterium]
MPLTSYSHAVTIHRNIYRRFAMLAVAFVTLVCASLPALAQTVPGAPTAAVATAGDTQASIAFTAPASNGGAAITIYTATANPGGAIGTCAGPAACPVTVTGLTNGVAYTFTVTATNSQGVGSASAASNSITPLATQTITFNSPGAQNFGTTPTLTATADSGLTPVFSSGTTGVCTITGVGALTFLTAGTCTIHANQPGNGSYLPAATVSRSFTVNAVLPGAPTIGIASPGNNQASVIFVAPVFNGGGITNYTVTSSPGGITATGASPIVVTGLTNGTAYTFTVKATTAAGMGPASAASNSVTPANPFPPLTPPAAVPGISGVPGVVDMGTGGGPAVASCSLDTIRQQLGGTVSYLGQNASGAMQFAWNGQVISFYPLTASTTTDSRPNGVQSLSSNTMDLVTACGTVNATPAVYNMAELGATLTGMGLNAQINAQGVISVVVNGAVYVVRPDFVVTPGTPGTPRLYVGADGLYRFADSSGNTQIMRPVVLDPDALKTQLNLLGGTLRVQIDGSALFALGGLNYVLAPDLMLGTIPVAQAAQAQWQDGPNHYVYRILTHPYANYGQGLTLTLRP